MRNIKILIRNNLLCLTDHKFYSQRIASLGMKYPMCVCSPKQACSPHWIVREFCHVRPKELLVFWRLSWGTCLVPLWLCPAWAAEAPTGCGTSTKHSCRQSLRKCCCGTSKPPEARASPAPRLLSLSQSQLITFSSQGLTLSVLAETSVSPSPSLEWGQCLHPRADCKIKKAKLSSD